MYQIRLFNQIAKTGTDCFDRTAYEVGGDYENPDAILVRSADLHSLVFNPNLKAIDRAGAGVNNIPLDRCAENGIVVFNTPGANANAVKELALCSLLLASRDITGGVEWVRTLKGSENIAGQIEKGKSRFAGCELKGKTLGVIGLGAIGGMVANVATHLGMDVVGCDPYITVEAAWSLSRTVKKAASYDEIFEKCDYISVHVPATSETKGMFCADAFKKMKKGVRIINLSRGELVKDDDLLEAVKDGTIASYVTDFASDKIVGADPHIVVMPHLGASTEESEENCAIMAAQELIEYLENGNIRNSVNLPNASMPHDGDARLCILHRNAPGVLSRISSVIASENLNIENMINRSRGDYAYTIVELIGDLPQEAVRRIEEMDVVIRVNQYKKG